jgi:nitroimidazol reductase NimA-like FMN-containing flavoprotein (pyridoxamine 5'-phosphate oxidase superfamily)
MTLDELTPAQCRSRLAEQRIGRLVYTDSALPCALPVNYALDADSIVFRTDSRGRIAATVPGAVVAFEVDCVDEDNARGWSVLIVGVAQPITAAAELEAAGRLDIDAWGASEGASLFLRIPLLRVTGRAVERGPRRGADSDLRGVTLAVRS